MSDDLAADYDLSSGKAWCGLHPGMTRSEVTALAAKAGLEASGVGSDPSWLILEGDRRLELRFETSGAERLRQISQDDDDLTWRGEPIIGGPLHEVWAVLKSEAENAGWAAGDAVNEPLDSSPATEATSGSITDEQLLYEGTLWLPKRGLGLVMCEGSLGDIVWRREEDLPRKLEGPVTAAQLALSQRPDLRQVLRKQMRPASASSATSTQWTPLQWVLALVFVVSMGTIVKLGLEEQSRWQQATLLDGHLTAFENPKGGRTAYHIAYNDPFGKRQKTVLEGADFYVAPREVGDAVQVCYVDGDPPRVKGPARARDAAFLRYMPWGTGVFLGYVICMMVAGWLGQRSRASATTGTQPKDKKGSGPGGLPPGVSGVKRF